MTPSICPLDERASMSKKASPSNSSERDLNITMRTRCRQETPTRQLQVDINQLRDILTKQASTKVRLPVLHEQRESRSTIKGAWWTIAHGEKDILKDILEDILKDILFFTLTNQRNLNVCDSHKAHFPSNISIQQAFANNTLNGIQWLWPANEKVE